MSFDDGDELIAASLSSGKDDIFMATRNGQSIRFAEDDVRAMGRNARGVRGISLDGDDEVVGMEVLPADAANVTVPYTLLSVTAKGYGKRTAITEYRTQGRGGSGIINVKVSDKVGQLVSVKKVNPSDDVIIISKAGQLIRIPANSISEIGRNTQGVRVISLDDNESVMAVAVVHEIEIAGVQGGSETLH
jgi:DNA gyrase subunit A